MAIFFYEFTANEPLTPTVTVTLSPRSLAIVIDAITQAEQRTNWQSGLDGLTDTEWANVENWYAELVDELGI